MLLRILAQRGSPFAEHMPHAEMEKLQERRLRAIVRHAYDNARFWHEWLDGAGLGPGDVTRLSDFRRSRSAPRKTCCRGRCTTG